MAFTTTTASKAAFPDQPLRINDAFCRSDHTKTMASKNILRIALFVGGWVYLLLTQKKHWLDWSLILSDISFCVAAFLRRLHGSSQTKVLLMASDFQLVYDSLQAMWSRWEHWLFSSRVTIR